MLPVAAALPPPNCSSVRVVQPAEPRNIVNGTVMLAWGYLDQPYCQVNPANDEWTCITTANPTREGALEHMISQVSTDEGHSWSSPSYIEPEGVGIDNSYGTLAISRTGRLYAMYNMNLDNVTKTPSGAKLSRRDELGHFVMRFSDNGGRRWSKQRFEVPYRLTALDRANPFNGSVKLMWCVDQVKTVGDSIVYGFTKIGNPIQNAPQELWFMSSDNLLTEKNASKISWKLLPEGEHGVLPPGVGPADVEGDIFEEAHIVPLRMGGFYAVGRTTQGYLGASWTESTLQSGLGGWKPAGYAQYWDVAKAAAGEFAPQAGSGVPSADPHRPGVGSAGINNAPFDIA